MKEKGREGVMWMKEKGGREGVMLMKEKVREGGMDAVSCISISAVVITSPTIGVSALGHGCRQLQLIDV